MFLRVEAGAVRNPGDNKYLDVGSAFGSRPRLILAHLNRKQSFTHRQRLMLKDLSPAYTPGDAKQHTQCLRYCRFKE